MDAGHSSVPNDLPHLVWHDSCDGLALHAIQQSESVSDDASGLSDGVSGRDLSRSFRKCSTDISSFGLFAAKLIVLFFSFELLLHAFTDRVKQLGLVSLWILFGLGIRMWL